MSEWPAPRELGFPSYPAERLPDLRHVTRILGWVPGMRVEPDTHYLVAWHSHDLSTYVAAGGTMDRALVHHLSWDTGTIDPLWGKATFKKRVAKMQAKGVQYVVAPDFSSWADYPIIVQMHNYYKSMRVTCDLVLAGFDVVPMVCWSAPQIARLSTSMWPSPLPCCVVDGSHVHSEGHDFNRRLFLTGARVFREQCRPARIFLWAGTPKTHDLWLKTFPDDAKVCVWAPSRAFMLGKLVTRTRRHSRAKTSAA